MTSPYLRADECAAYLRFPSTAAFREWARRRRIPFCRRGRVLLYEVKVIDALLHGTRLRP